MNQEEIELESDDQSWSIGKLINDIQFFEKDTFENVYKRYHSEKDLETLFENAHKVLVNNKSIAEGVDFKQLEEVMGAKYLFFVFSRTLKSRELSFAQFIYFLREREETKTWYFTPKIYVKSKKRHLSPIQELKS